MVLSWFAHVCASLRRVRFAQVYARFAQGLRKVYARFTLVCAEQILFVQQGHLRKPGGGLRRFTHGLRRFTPVYAVYAQGNLLMLRPMSFGSALDSARKAINSAINDGQCSCHCSHGYYSHYTSICAILAANVAALDSARKAPREPDGRRTPPCVAAPPGAGGATAAARAAPASGPSRGPTLRLAGPSGPGQLLSSGPTRAPSGSSAPGIR
jgi:hypothetical protein